MPAFPTFAARKRLLPGLILVPLTVALMAGCAKPKDPTDPTTTGAIGPAATTSDFERAASYWGEQYARDEKSKDASLNYAAALLRVGRTDQSVAVLQKTVIYHPDDRDVLASYGKSLAAAGKFDIAIETIRRAQTPDRPDWRLMSAEAAILDQVGRNAEARQLYSRALTLSPGEPSVLSNYGMSYVLTGELPKAEKLLREAIMAQGADSRVRQNLALVVGLQGRFDEAQQIASAELSPEQAAANMAYLRDMLTQRDSWQALRSGGATG